MTQQSARLRFGVMSPAAIAVHKVIPAIQRSELCEVVAIASRDAGRAADVAEQLGIPRHHGSYDDLLADPDVEAVYIPLPNHLHAEWTLRAAARRQARAVREAAGAHRGASGRDGRGLPSGRGPA